MLQAGASRTALIAVCGLAVWAAGARLLRESRRRRIVGDARVNVRLALLRALASPITKSFAARAFLRAGGALPPLETAAVKLRMSSHKFSRLARGLAGVWAPTQSDHG
jgi:hypothetical protein